MTRRIIPYTKDATETYSQVPVVSAPNSSFINVAHPLYRGGGVRGLVEAYNFADSKMGASGDPCIFHYGPDGKHRSGLQEAYVDFGSGNYTGPGTVVTPTGQAFGYSGSGYYGHGVKVANSGIQLGSPTYGLDGHCVHVLIFSVDSTVNNWSPIVGYGTWQYGINDNAGQLEILSKGSTVNSTPLNIDRSRVYCCVFRSSKDQGADEEWNVWLDGGQKHLLNYAAEGSTSSGYFDGHFYHLGQGSAVGTIQYSAGWNGWISDDQCRDLSARPELLFPRMMK